MDIDAVHAIMKRMAPAISIAFTCTCIALHIVHNDVPRVHATNDLSQTSDLESGGWRE